MSDIIKELEKEQLRSDLPELQVGDLVAVYVKVIEGNRERLQSFEGIVIKIQGGGVRKSFTVRRISYGVGVERGWCGLSERSRASRDPTAGVGCGGGMVIGVGRGNGGLATMGWV